MKTWNNYFLDRHSIEPVGIDHSDILPVVDYIQYPGNVDDPYIGRISPDAHLRQENISEDIYAGPTNYIPPTNIGAGYVGGNRWSVGPPALPEPSPSDSLMGGMDMNKTLIIGLGALALGILLYKIF